MACKEACRINKRLLPVKTSYFFIIGALASLFPYLGVYMKHLGLSPGETAIIYGTMPFLGAFIRTAVGALGDKLQCHKLLLMICCIGSGISHMCILAVPPVNQVLPSVNSSPKVRILCESQQSQIHYCTDIRLLPGYECQVSASLSMNMTPSSNDPFLNSSDCTLQCESNLDTLPQDGSLCFMPVGTNDYHECPDRVVLENDTISELEFTVEEMNRSLTPFQFDPLTQESHVCHTYSMAAFLYNGTAYQKLICQQPMWLNCQVTCRDLTKTTMAPSCNPDSRDYKQKYGSTFWLFFIIYFIGNIFFSPVISLVDAMTYNFLGEERGKWGKQRLWGSIGFILAGTAAGFSMDAMYTSKSSINFMFCFISFAVMNLMAAVSGCFYKISGALTCSHIAKNICLLLQKLEITSLFLAILVQGMLNGVIETFLFWHLKTLGAKHLLLGLCLLIMCLLEIPMLFVAGHVIKRLGQFHCLNLSLLAMAGRFIAYSFLSNPWYVLLVEPLHSLTFGLMYAAATSYGSIVTPPGMHGTVQGILAALYFGMGKGIGSILGGQVFEHYGPVITFRACAVLAVVTLAVYFACQLYLGNCTSNEPERPADDEEERKDVDIKASMIRSNDEEKLNDTRDQVQTSPKPRPQLVSNSHSGLTDPLVASETNTGGETTV